MMPDNIGIDPYLFFGNNHNLWNERKKTILINGQIILNKSVYVYFAASAYYLSQGIVNGAFIDLE